MALDLLPREFGTRSGNSLAGLRFDTSMCRVAFASPVHGSIIMQ